MKELEITLHNGEKIRLIEKAVDNITVYATPDRVEVLGTYTPRTGEIDFPDAVQSNWCKYAKSIIGNCYLDYVHGGFNIMTTHILSFRSLLKSETQKAFPLKENPYPKRPKIIRGQYAVMENESLTEAIDNTNKFNESESQVMPQMFVVLMIKNGT